MTMPPDEEPIPVAYSECQEAVRRLTEWLDKELGPMEEARVQQHLNECSGCFARFHFEETLLHTIRTRVETLRAPAGLRDKILSLIGPRDSDEQDRPEPPHAS